MKVVKFILVFVISTILFISCNKESDGNVIISIDNQNLYNQSDYFVEAGIVFFESDSGLLENFGRSDISEGGMVEFDPVSLSVGNYYVRYQFFLGNATSGGELHKPFQVQAGEDTVIKIIR